MCMSLFCCGASAVELDTKGSITLHVADYVTAEPIPDMTFRLYFFASAHEKANGIGYEYVSPYDECNMVLGNLEDSYLSVHLSHYANTHSLPYTEKTTDAEGNAAFTNLRAGLYLAVFSKSGNNYFVPSPFVILVPRFDEENLNWDFDVIARPKMISYSWIDAVFGTLATFLASLCTYYARNIKFKNIPFLSMFFPVIFNAVIIGLEINIFFLPQGEEFTFIGFVISLTLTDTKGLCNFICC